MADSHGHPEPQQDSGASPDGGTVPGRPRLVVVLGIVVAIALLVVIVLLHLTGVVGPGAT